MLPTNGSSSAREHSATSATEYLNETTLLLHWVSNLCFLFNNTRSIVNIAYHRLVNLVSICIYLCIAVSGGLISFTINSKVCRFGVDR